MNTNIHKQTTLTSLPRAPGFPPARDFLWLSAGGILLLLLVALWEFRLLPPLLGTLFWPLQIILGFAYVLYVPGYCLQAALFPHGDDLDGIERTGLSLGLSIAWVPVLALLLDWLPWGLRLWPILLGELGSMVLFMAVALWRRGRLPAAEAYAPALSWRPRPWWATLSQYERRIYRLCAAALLLAGLSAAWVFLVPSPDEFMTEFYVLGSEGLAENYPRAAAVGETLAVTMGIANKERSEETYRVEVWVIETWGQRRQMVSAAGPFSLAPGESLEQAITWAMPWAGDDQQVEFWLFRDGQAGAEPYRQLRLWLDVGDG